MLSYNWPRVRSLMGSAGAAGLSCLLVLEAPFTPAVAKEPRRIEFRGELDYDLFERAARQRVTIHVKSSPGGTGAAAKALAKVRGLVIDGPCNSACAWAFVRSKSACFTQRASFGFHGAYDPGTNRLMLPATNYWLNSTRGGLRQRIEGIKSSGQVIHIGASEMTQYYPERACLKSAPGGIALQNAEVR